MGVWNMFAMHSGAFAPPEYPWAHNFYGDTELITAARAGSLNGYEEGFLDFYSVHFYDAYGTPNWRSSLNNVLEHDRSSYGPFNKPVIVGELSWAGIPWAGGVGNIYRSVYDRHWAGVLGWQLTAGPFADRYENLMAAMVSLQELPGCESINLNHSNTRGLPRSKSSPCLLYTSDAADE